MSVTLNNDYQIFVWSRVLIHSITLYLKKILTLKDDKSILVTSREVIGIGVPNPQRRMPLQCGIFMRKISVHLYVDLGKTVERLASSLGWYANLIQVDSIIGVMWSGLKTYPTEAIMPEHVQVPFNKRQLSIYVSLKSIFTLLDSNKKPIAKDLNFNQAKGISEHIQGSIIKFQAIIKAEVTI